MKTKKSCEVSCVSPKGSDTSEAHLSPPRKKRRRNQLSSDDSTNPETLSALGNVHRSCLSSKINDAKNKVLVSSVQSSEHMNTDFGNELAKLDTINDKQCSKVARARHKSGSLARQHKVNDTSKLTVCFPFKNRNTYGRKVGLLDSGLPASTKNKKNLKPKRPNCAKNLETAENNTNVQGTGRPGTSSPSSKSRNSSQDGVKRILSFEEHTSEKPDSDLKSGNIESEINSEVNGPSVKKKIHMSPIDSSHTEIKADTVSILFSEEKTARKEVSPNVIVTSKNCRGQKIRGSKSHENDGNRHAVAEPSTSGSELNPSAVSENSLTQNEHRNGDTITNLENSVSSDRNISMVQNLRSRDSRTVRNARQRARRSRLNSEQSTDDDSSSVLSLSDVYDERCYEYNSATIERNSRTPLNEEDISSLTPPSSAVAACSPVCLKYQAFNLKPCTVRIIDTPGIHCISEPPVSAMNVGDKGIMDSSDSKQLATETEKNRILQGTHKRKFSCKKITRKTEKNKILEGTHKRKLGCKQFTRKTKKNKIQKVTHKKKFSKHRKNSMFKTIIKYRPEDSLTKLLNDVRNKWSEDKDILKYLSSLTTCEAAVSGQPTLQSSDQHCKDTVVVKASASQCNLNISGAMTAVSGNVSASLLTSSTSQNVSGEHKFKLKKNHNQTLSESKISNVRHPSSQKQGKQTSSTQSDLAAVKVQGSKTQNPTHTLQNESATAAKPSHERRNILYSSGSITREEETTDDLKAKIKPCESHDMMKTISPSQCDSICKDMEVSVSHENLSSDSPVQLKFKGQERSEKCCSTPSDINLQSHAVPSQPVTATEIHKTGNQLTSRSRRLKKSCPDTNSSDTNKATYTSDCTTEKSKVPSPSDALLTNPKMLTGKRLIGSSTLVREENLQPNSSVESKMSAELAVSQEKTLNMNNQLIQENILKPANVSNKAVEKKTDVVAAPKRKKLVREIILDPVINSNIKEAECWQKSPSAVQLEKQPRENIKHPRKRSETATEAEIKQKTVKSLNVPCNSESVTKLAEEMEHLQKRSSAAEVLRKPSEEIEQLQMSPTLEAVALLSQETDALQKRLFTSGPAKIFEEEQTMTRFSATEAGKNPQSIQTEQPKKRNRSKPSSVNSSPRMATRSSVASRSATSDASSAEESKPEDVLQSLNLVRSPVLRNEQDSDSSVKRECDTTNCRSLKDDIIPLNKISSANDARATVPDDKSKCVVKRTIGLNGSKLSVTLCTAESSSDDTSWMLDGFDASKSAAESSVDAIVSNKSIEHCKKETSPVKKAARKTIDKPGRRMDTVSLRPQCIQVMKRKKSNISVIKKMLANKQLENIGLENQRKKQPGSKLSNVVTPSNSSRGGVKRQTVEIPSKSSSIVSGGKTEHRVLELPKGIKTVTDLQHGQKNKSEGEIQPNFKSSTLGITQKSGADTAVSPKSKTPKLIRPDLQINPFKVPKPLSLVNKSNREKSSPSNILRREEPETSATNKSSSSSCNLVANEREKVHSSNTSKPNILRKLADLSGKELQGPSPCETQRKKSSPLTSKNKNLPTCNASTAFSAHTTTYTTTNTNVKEFSDVLHTTKTVTSSTRAMNKASVTLDKHASENKSVKTKTYKKQDKSDFRISTSQAVDPVPKLDNSQRSSFGPSHEPDEDDVISLIAPESMFSEMDLSIYGEAQSSVSEFCSTSSSSQVQETECMLPTQRWTEQESLQQSDTRPSKPKFWHKSRPFRSYMEDEDLDYEADNPVSPQQDSEVADSPVTPQQDGEADDNPVTTQHSPPQPNSQNVPVLSERYLEENLSDLLPADYIDEKAAHEGIVVERRKNMSDEESEVPWLEESQWRIPESHQPQWHQERNTNTGTSPVTGTNHCRTASSSLTAAAVPSCASGTVAGPTVSMGRRPAITKSKSPAIAAGTDPITAIGEHTSTSDTDRVSDTVVGMSHATGQRAGPTGFSNVGPFASAVAESGTRTSSRVSGGNDNSYTAQGKKSDAWNILPLSTPKASTSHSYILKNKGQSLLNEMKKGYCYQFLSRSMCQRTSCFFLHQVPNVENYSDTDLELMLEASLSGNHHTLWHAIATCLINRAAQEKSKDRWLQLVTTLNMQMKKGLAVVLEDVMTAVGSGDPDNLMLLFEIGCRDPNEVWVVCSTLCHLLSENRQLSASVVEAVLQVIVLPRTPARRPNASLVKFVFNSLVRKVHPDTLSKVNKNVIACFVDLLRQSGLHECADFLQMQLVPVSNQSERWMPEGHNPFPRTRGRKSPITYNDPPKAAPTLPSVRASRDNATGRASTSFHTPNYFHGPVSSIPPIHPTLESQRQLAQLHHPPPKDLKYKQADSTHREISYDFSASPSMEMPASLRRKDTINKPMPYLNERVLFSDFEHMRESVQSNHMSEVVCVLNKWKNHNLASRVASETHRVLAQEIQSAVINYSDLLNSAATCSSQGTIQVDDSLQWMLSSIGMSLMLSTVKQNRWNDAYRVCYHMLNHKLDILKSEVFEVQQFSDLDKVLLICKIYLHNNFIHEAAQILEGYELLTPNAERWMDQMRDDTKSVWAELCNSLISQGIALDHPLEAAKFLIQLLDNQPNLKGIIDFTKYVDKLLAALINTSQPANVLQLYARVHRYHYTVEQPTLRALLVTMMSVGEIDQARKLYGVAVDVRVYPQLTQQKPYHIRIFSYWLKEEIALIISEFLQRLVRSIEPSKLEKMNLNEELSVILYIEPPTKPPPPPPHSTIFPEILYKVDFQLSAVHRRIQEVLMELKPSLMAQFGSTERMIKLNPQSVYHHLQSCLQEQRAWSLR